MQVEHAGLSPGHRVFFLLSASGQQEHRQAQRLEPADNSRTPGADAYVGDFVSLEVASLIRYWSI